MCSEGRIFTVSCLKNYEGRTKLLQVIEENVADTF